MRVHARMLAAVSSVVVLGASAVGADAAARYHR